MIYMINLKEFSGYLHIYFLKKLFCLFRYVLIKSVNKKYKSIVLNIYE